MKLMNRPVALLVVATLVVATLAVGLAACEESLERAELAECLPPPAQDDAAGFTKPDPFEPWQVLEASPR